LDGMIVTECGDECVNAVLDIIGRSMSWWSRYYAEACLELGFCRALAAILGSSIVGGVVYYTIPLRSSKPSVGVIYYIAVEVEYRGRGIGSALVLSAEESTNASIYMATTRRSNTASLRLFESLGYRAAELDEISGEAGSLIDKALCSYEDDVLLYKGVEGVEELASVLKMFRGDVETFHREACYNPWRRLRGV